MRSLCAAVLAIYCGISSVAYAGDPCPIGITIQDLGSPEWLDNTALIRELDSSQTWIGIRFKHTDEGLLLTHVFQGAPAELAGLQIGDLLTKINGASADDREEIGDFFDSIKIGDALEIEIIRDEQALTITLIVGGADPVPLAILDFLETDDCRAPRIETPTDDMRQDVMARIFTETNGFRCEDAHIKLQPLLEKYQSETIYFIRGSRRVLLTMPYYGTACMSAAALDGEGLNTVTVEAFIDRVIGRYVQERHENP